jgi:hypothetical protein
MYASGRRRCGAPVRLRRHRAGADRSARGGGRTVLHHPRYCITLDTLRNGLPVHVTVETPVSIPAA